MSILKVFRRIQLARLKPLRPMRSIMVLALFGAGLVGCTGGSTATSSPGASSATSRSFAPATPGVTMALASVGASTSPGTNPSVKAVPTAEPAAALFTCASRTLAWDGKSPIDLTGTWNGNDEGVYYLRQIGDQVWWLGMSGLGRPFADRGSDWTNVYRGTLKGDTVTGTYADVPQGQILDKGPVVMKLTPTADGGISLERTDPLLETGFGGTEFTPCKLGS
jgi:hypothetical protein